MDKNRYFGQYRKNILDKIFAKFTFLLLLFLSLCLDMPATIEKWVSFAPLLTNFYQRNI